MPTAAAAATAPLSSKSAGQPIKPTDVNYISPLTAELLRRPFARHVEPDYPSIASWLLYYLFHFLFHFERRNAIKSREREFLSAAHIAMR